MYKYNVQIQKVSGKLNESVLPSKNLVVKSKTKKTNKQVFDEASRYFEKKYGLVIESADVERLEDDRRIHSEIMSEMCGLYSGYLDGYQTSLPIGARMMDDGSVELVYHKQNLEGNGIDEVYFTQNDFECLMASEEMMTEELQELLETGEIEGDLYELLDEEVAALVTKINQFAEGKTQIDPEGWSVGYCQFTRNILHELEENITTLKNKFLYDL